MAEILSNWHTALTIAFICVVIAVGIVWFIIENTKQWKLIITFYLY